MRGDDKEGEKKGSSTWKSPSQAMQISIHTSSWALLWRKSPSCAVRAGLLDGKANACDKCLAHSDLGVVSLGFTLCKK